jgi:hypothetical protein
LTWDDANTEDDVDVEPAAAEKELLDTGPMPPPPLLP